MTRKPMVILIMAGFLMPGPVGAYACYAAENEEPEGQRLVRFPHPPPSRTQSDINIRQLKRMLISAVTRRAARRESRVIEHAICRS